MARGVNNSLAGNVLARTLPPFNVVLGMTQKGLFFSRENIQRMKNLFFVSVLAAALFLPGASLFAFDNPASALCTAELQVRNLTCGACVQNIEKALTGLNGVSAIEVDLQSGTARISYDGRVVSPAAVANRISRAGYPARVRTSSTFSAPESRAVPAVAPGPPSGKPGCGGGCCAAQKQG